MFDSQSGKMVTIMFDYTIACSIQDGLTSIRQKMAEASRARPSAMTMYKGIVCADF